METHFVCTGECGGVATQAQVCQAEVCSEKGKPLTPCTCEDGAHHEVKSEKPQESEEAPASL
jgi:hypothetical protein